MKRIIGLLFMFAAAGILPACAEQSGTPPAAATLPDVRQTANLRQEIDQAIGKAFPAIIRISVVA
ncbi:MAG: hypothetical protein HZA50_01790 [Planctomycetes bacterium]|nr:hypothetical protein [Planctomycetota bacterium]